MTLTAQNLMEGHVGQFRTWQFDDILAFVPEKDVLTVITLIALESSGDWEKNQGLVTTSKGELWPYIGIFASQITEGMGGNEEPGSHRWQIRVFYEIVKHRRSTTRTPILDAYLQYTQMGNDLELAWMAIPYTPSVGSYLHTTRKIYTALEKAVS